MNDVDCPILAKKGGTKK